MRSSNTLRMLLAVVEIEAALMDKAVATCHEFKLQLMDDGKNRYQVACTVLLYVYTYSTSVEYISVPP